MKNFRKILSIFLALCMLASLAACARQNEAPEATTPTGTASYQVSLTTQGGMPMEGIDIYIYEDESRSELAFFGRSDETGCFEADLPQKDGYAIVLESVPKGYEAEEHYAFEGFDANIRLQSHLIQGESLSGVQLGLGDVMVDFTVTDSQGNEITLSEMLHEKDMVLLNFFFTTCGPCANEFPYMQEGYEQFRDSVGIIALDPLDDANTVATYQASMGLTFPMAACQPAWSQSFSITGYPTSIVIDRYGVICLIEVGGLTSLRPFTVMFETFTGDDYTQKLYGSLDEMVTTITPTFTMASSDEVAAILGAEDIPVSFRPETDPGSAEYSWPFIEAEKLGEKCLKASNQAIDGSYAILYTDAQLEAGQALAFDYLASSEKGCDIMFVIVDDQDVFAISGWDETEKWQTCYSWVAQKAGKHEVALCYLKDGDTNEADDTVYIKNFRIVSESEIDEPTYIPQLAAQTEDEFTYTYPEIFLSEADGYYHVGSETGPLLLADLMNYTEFSQEKTVWELVYESGLQLDGVSYYDTMVNYFSYASNSAIYGMVPVDPQLREYLLLADEQFGFDENDENEWLKCCTYYAAYGTQTQLADPCAGLSTFSALPARLGVGVESNFFYYDRPIMPRGLLARFTPERSGVYKITSHTDSPHGVEAWVFQGDDRENHYTYEADQRLQPDVTNCHIYYYMEAGQNYYIDIAFWDIYEVGTIPYDIEYVGASYDVFRLASPGFFTYDPGATGADMYHLIAGGIDVVLGPDGYYYEDLGDGKRGSKLYADFTGVTGLFSEPLMSVPAYDEAGKPVYDEKGQAVMVKGIIDMGGFDFSKTENDQYILSILEKYNGDTQAAEEYLRAYWGEDFEANAESYQLEDVFAGRYHGSGEDYTDDIEAYLGKVIRSGPEALRGCVPVDEELASLLQKLVDKFTFSGVDHSWTKMCYYYDHLGN